MRTKPASMLGVQWDHRNETACVIMADAKGRAMAFAFESEADAKSFIRKLKSCYSVENEPIWDP